MKSRDVRDIGSRLELFVDEWLAQELKRVEYRLHEPFPREVALVTDAPWEGNRAGYVTAFADGDVVRMYYKAHHGFLVEDGPGKYREDFTPLRIAYAESRGGFKWEKPELGICEIDGSKRNNVIWDGVGPDRIGTHGFTPFKDEKPGLKPENRYKAFGRHGTGDGAGLYGMQSADGLHWELISDKPLITEGGFDSQNVGFWDSVAGTYRSYIRDKHPAEPEESMADANNAGMRDIRTCTSPDFLDWTDPQMLEYTGSPEQPLYVNQILPYPRAPHILLGFPARYVERPWGEVVELLPEVEHRRKMSARSPRLGTVVTDGLFMASRDEKVFHKWPDVFIRPGPQLKDKWIYGDNHQSLGLFETASGLPDAPEEYSFVVTESYWQGEHTTFRRYSIRKDGFVGVHANLFGGELITRPLTFTGEDLYINFSTSAYGRIRVELQEPGGKPLEGLSLADCIDSVGDELGRKVHWKNSQGLTGLAGKPVRLRFAMKDADLYAIRFASSPAG